METLTASTDDDDPVVVNVPTRSPTDDHRWYAVVVGRNPGVFYST